MSNSFCAHDSPWVCISQGVGPSVCSFESLIPQNIQEEAPATIPGPVLLALWVMLLVIAVMPEDNMPLFFQQWTTCKRENV